MKTAIIHDHFLYHGGAERVLFTLLKMFPNADVYTAFITKNNYNQLKQLTSSSIEVSPYNNLLFYSSLADWYKPLIFNYWESIDLTQYDLVISASHSFSSNSVITHPRTCHISYVHTPPRYLYTEFNETQVINKQPIKTLISPIMTYLRMKDYISAQRPDILIANSKTVQKRIQKYYRRDSTVIYPPVKIPKRLPIKQKGEYFLMVSRLVKQKGIDLAIKACNKLNEKLVIVGEGSEEKYLKSIAGPSITFLGFVPDEKMADIYSKTKALIYCSKEEDFGIVPVESMAHCVPVIAYKSGAVNETIVHSKTGILFDDYTVDGISQEIKNFAKSYINSKEYFRQAQKFSETIFIQKMNQVITAFRVNSRK